MKVLEFSSTYLFHSTNKEYSPGDLLQWKGAKTKGTFGDYEKLIEKNRPASAHSRLSSFYTAKTKRESEIFDVGMYTYKVLPVGKITPCALGWFSLLMVYVKPEGYRKNYGYIVNVNKAMKDPKVTELCKNYWKGIVPTKKQFDEFDRDMDVESKVIEVLCSKIKIVKEV